MIETTRTLGRKALMRVLAGTILSSSTACSQPIFIPKSQLSSENTTSTTKERETPSEGDVVFVDGNFNLLRNGLRYVIPDIELYKKYTKFEKYKRRIFFSSNSSIVNLPVGESKSTTTIFDDFTGYQKDTKRFGGEITVFWSGFMDDESVPYATLIPSSTFEKIRSKECLGAKGWGDKDSLFFTWGTRGLNTYKGKDTAKDPRLSIQQALEFFEQLKKDYPLAQFNFICHSLGGNIAMEVAKKHADAINNIILLDSPIRGLRRTPGKMAEVVLFRADLLRRGIHEDVTEYLFGLWNNKHHAELNEFFYSFTRSGKKIISYYMDGDLAIPKESVEIPGGVREIERDITPEEEKKTGLLTNIVLYAKRHGRSLTHPRVLKEIPEEIGENLALAA